MKKVFFKISGMNCTSCVINIDEALEEIAGVSQAKTNYAKSQTDVLFNPKQVSPHKMLAVIKQVGYEAEIVS